MGLISALKDVQSEQTDRFLNNNLQFSHLGTATLKPQTNVYMFFSFPSLNKDSFLQFENTPEEPEVRVLVRSDCAISQSILLTG